MFNTSISYVASAIKRTSVGLWRVFEVFSNFMDHFWMVFGLGLLLAMWLLLFLNAIARWTEWYSIGWSLEIVAFMVAWSIFIMAGPVTRRNAHIKVTFLPEKLLSPKKAEAFINVGENIIGMALCIYLTIQAYRFVDNTYHLDLVKKSVSGWEYPLWAVRCGILAGFLFSSVYYFERTVKWISSLFIGKEAEEEGLSN